MSFMVPQRYTVDIKQSFVKMASLSFNSLKGEYSRLFAEVEIKADWRSRLVAAAKKVLKNRAVYEHIAETTGVPWYVIGVWHMRESGNNFRTHLHNGDPLSARTKHVPAGRPKAGSPPFTWDFSAIDALTMKGFRPGDRVWDVARICYETERYNGFGYRNMKGGPLSPYLWQGTGHYADSDSKAGKYVADGKYSGAAVDAQCGAIAVLKVLMEMEPSIRLPTVKSVVKTMKESPSLRTMVNDFVLKIVALVMTVWAGIEYVGLWLYSTVESWFGILPDKAAQAEQAIMQAQRLSELSRIPWPAWAGLGMGALIILYPLFRQLGQKRVVI